MASAWGSPQEDSFTGTASGVAQVCPVRNACPTFTCCRLVGVNTRGGGRRLYRGYLEPQEWRRPRGDERK